MNGRTRVGAGLGLAVPAALAGFFFAAGCGRPPPPPPELVRPVKIMVVVAGNEPHVRSFPGTVEASRKVELAFRVAGLLVDLPVREGQRVAEGELIAQLRQDEFQARLTTLQGRLDQAWASLRALRAGERPEQRLRLEAQVRSAQATLANSRLEHSRSSQLLRSGSIARAENDRRLTDYRVAQEQYQAARQELEKGTMAREEDLEAQEAVIRGLEGEVVEAGIQLGDATLRAPYGGVIAQRFVEPNQNVRVKDPVVKFQDVDEILVAVDVPEKVMAAELLTADIVQVVAHFSGAPGVWFPVQIREIAQRADPATQTFRVRAAMKSPAGVNLLPGMTATLTLTYQRARVLGHRILVPISAVTQTGLGEQVVWIVGPDQTVARRSVTLGEATGSRIEILDGLQPGDRIAVAGAAAMREGMRVRDLGDALGGGQ